MSGPDRPLALVTGGAVRVGRAICYALARAGCDIHFTYLSSGDAASELHLELSRIPAPGGAIRAAVTRLDLDDPHAVEDFGSDLARRSPRIDILVHNASIYAPTPLAETSPENALRFFRTNALAPLLLSKQLAPRLAQSPRAGGGAIVAMCDIHASERPRARFAPYSMSKAALEQMVRTLALELAPRVRVNAVAPGVVAFPQSGHESDPEMQVRYLARVPLERSGTPEDAAEAVRWLAIDATYTTGMTLRVDGGRWVS